jgi:hypothetical protein
VQTRNCQMRPVKGPPGGGRRRPERLTDGRRINGSAVALAMAVGNLATRVCEKQNALVSQRASVSSEAVGQSAGMVRPAAR